MLYSFLLLISCLPTFKSLIQPGFFDSFDGGFHLVRLIHFYNEITQGQFPVRFGTQMAFGYGYPVFNFFYPLVYYLGSIIHFFGTSYGLSLKIIIATSFFLSSIFCYKWLKQHFSPLASFAGAFLYIYAPYRFSVNFVSTSMGTVLAFVFAPLLLYAISNFFLNKNRRILPLISLSIALLLLSHNVSALIFISIATLYIIFLSFANHTQTKQVKNILFSFLLAIGLTSFFIFPMISDLKFVKLSTNIAVNYADHFPTLKQLIYSPWGYGSSITGPNDKESFQIGIAQWFIFGFSFFLFSVKLFSKRLKSLNDKILIFFIIAFCTTIFFMLPISNFVWQHFKIIQQIQYPWRLLMATTLIAPFLASWSIDNLKKFFRYPFFILILFLAFYGNRNHFLTPNFYRYPDSYYIDNQYLYFGSTDIAWESRPVWSNFTPHRFPDTPINPNADILSYKILNNLPKQRLNLLIENQTSTTVTFNHFYYPNWIVKNNQKIISSYPNPENGLLNVDIPQGTNNISISYQSTPIQTFSNYISLFSILVLLFYAYKLNPNLRAQRDLNPRSFA